jgi:hypothetical protein
VRTSFEDTPVDALDMTLPAEEDDGSPPLWPLRAVLFASACIVVGVIWDISWHSTIGRDTFWTLPHLLEQLGALVAGLSCGWLALRITFAGTPPQRAASVKFWGFSGPLGAWVAIWGTILMIASAPFDNWWHNAYGLDVKIVSPPHMVLALGMVAIQVGAILMALAAQNRAGDAGEAAGLGWAYAVAGGVLVAMVATLITEYASRPNQMHSPLFYQVAAGAFPVFLAAFARSGRVRYPAVTTAAIYMGIVASMIWILPRFPARPQLAPIYNAVTHMVPPHFPLLLVVPAFAVDLLVRRQRGRSDWTAALLAGLAFLALLVVVQWFFGEFLLTRYARNVFFGADQWPYFIKPGDWQYRFWDVPKDAAGRVDPLTLAQGLGLAALVAIASTRIGIWWGNGMSRVMR